MRIPRPVYRYATDSYECPICGKLHRTIDLAYQCAYADYLRHPDGE